MSTLSKQVSGQQRLLIRAVRNAKALIAEAEALGLAVTKRRYRRRKKGAAKPGPKPKSGKKHPIHRSREEE